MRRQGEANPLKRPRGVLLLGVPGTGKSQFCKALGNETGRPTLTLDIGSLMGSLVGQTESNIRQALSPSRKRKIGPERKSEAAAAWQRCWMCR
jgi:SpoVK/Ycf46/Vps4 family AAA+-type ATPase